jgi:D-amino-acid dehydrogenase
MVARDRSMTMRIAVIGAGILGASTAYHAARAGAEVVVVDHAHEGQATAAGAGIVCPWVGEADDPAFYRIAAAGGAYYSELLPALTGQELGFARVGALCVAANDDELDALERIVRQRRAEAPAAGAITRLPAAEARKLFPPLHPALGAVHIAGAARVDGRKLAAALLHAARSHGAATRAGLARLVTEGNRVTGVALATETVAADMVVVAAGAWAPALLEPIGLALAVAPQRGQIVHLGLPGQATAAWPVVLPRGSHYLLSFDDSRVVVGATRESHAGFDYRVTAAGQAEVLREALRVAPGLACATVLETRIGFRPVGPDARPLLGLAPHHEGLLIGNGLGPSGLTIGPFAGRLLAELALGQAPAFDLAPYRPLRGLR